jgi:hypothetical protein
MKKKMMVAAMAGLLTASAFGQSMVKETGRTTFGIRAGVNFQNINGKDAAGNDLKNDLLTGFNAGINAEIPLSSGFYLQPGALYSTKGAKWNNDSKVKLSYIEVPVNFVYKPILGTGNMLLGFGPYVGFGINGKVESPNGSSEAVKFSKDYDATSGSPQFKRFDAGGNLLAGYEFANNVSFQVNAQLGLADINPNTTAANDKTKFNNTGFGLSLGYKF